MRESDLDDELGGFGESFSYGKPIDLPGDANPVHVYINPDFNQSLTPKTSNQNTFQRWRKQIIIRNQFTLIIVYYIPRGRPRIEPIIARVA